MKIIFSTLSLIFVGFLTYSVIDWHQNESRHGHKIPSFFDRRGLMQQQEEETWKLTGVVDDDEILDETCRHYLAHFLNGTTDAKDDCDGMKNAFEAADCEDEGTQERNLVASQRFTVDQQPDDDGDNGENFSISEEAKTDDFMIDDDFEARQCCSSIYTFYSVNCREPQLDSIRLLGIVTVLVLCGLVKSLNKQFQLEWIPGAATCILVGATVGGMVRIFSKDMIQNNMAFDNDLFLHILLPPIIFQSAITIDKRAFRRDLFPILFFAILGTFASAIMIGFIANFLTTAGKATTLPMIDSMIFGSLISSIDPVATLGILSGAGVGQSDTLYTLIFGESLLNDGVSIVLFDTLIRFVGNTENSGEVDKTLMHQVVKDFFRVGFGSIGIGLACGVVCTIYFWALRRRHNAVTETAIFFCFALIPFYISDGAGLSGIISIMTMGFFLDFFVIGGSQDDDTQWMAFMQRQIRQENEPARMSLRNVFKFYKAFAGDGHMSSRSKHHVGFVAEVIASLMETSIFAYLGLFLFNDKHFWDFRMNLVAVLGCVASRALMVGVFSMIINFFVWLDLENRLGRFLMMNRGREREGESDESMGSTARVYLDRKTQLIVLLAGVRGAVSFALVENVPVYDAVRGTGSQYKPELKGMTSASIVFTVFVFGALTHFIVEKDKQSGDGMLTRRLLSDPLGSSDDEASEGSSVPHERGNGV